MKKLIILFAILAMATGVWADSDMPHDQPFSIDGASGGTITGDTTVGGDLTVGTISSDDVQPIFSIIGDADSDAGGDTDEILTITLTPNATPTSARWKFTTSQSNGFQFNKKMFFGNVDEGGAAVINVNHTLASGTGADDGGIKLNVKSEIAASEVYTATAVIGRWTIMAPDGGDYLAGSELVGVRGSSFIGESGVSDVHLDLSGVEGYGITTVLESGIVGDSYGGKFGCANTSGVASADITMENCTSLLIKTADADGSLTVNGDTIGIDIQDQPAGSYGIVLRDGSDGHWMDGLGGTGLMIETVTVSTADIKSATTPVTIISKRAGVILEYVDATVVYDDATDYTACDAAFVFEYETSGTDVSAEFDAHTILTANADAILLVDKVAITADVLANVNKDIMMLNTGTQCATGTGTLDVKITYKAQVTGL